MNKPSRKWNEGTKAADKRKTVFTTLQLKSKQGANNERESFSFKFAKIPEFESH